ncbi:DUF1120 domain-containing protein [Cupriavidus agavae]|uniref:Uncharacterized protein DUF1120 n=1 Tax=Cupriavidus agavae TaxID=1001822 RepID=A0A4Q7S704_9BURK|nr:DUF1120 domain-containing protein [Cupriavidus agavae]RZT42063.1 uncharacterized protein DUF1120 [Cupriavidus agavae]
MKNTAAFTLLALACAGAPAVAAETADLGVGGKVRPGICNISLDSYTGGSVVDYGNIDIDKLIKDADGNGHLLDAGVTVSVACGAGIQVGLTVSDGRAGTVPAGFDTAIAENYAGITPVAGASFGLGSTTDGALIGGYLMHLAPQFGGVKIGTADAGMLRSDDSGATWTALASGGENAGARIMLPSGKRVHTWASTTDGKVNTTPAAVTTASARYEIFSVILPKDDLPLTGEIAIDGQATFTLVYL